MLAPETLSLNQKLFLFRAYGLDVDAKVRYRRRDRFAIMFAWLGPALATGLLWENSLGAMTFWNRPTEVVGWCLVSFLLIGNAVSFGTMWKEIKHGRKNDQPSTFYWYMLFRDNIRPPLPIPIRLIGRASFYAVLIIAILNGRFALGIAWAFVFELGRSRREWETRVVQRELNSLSDQQ